MFQNQAFQCLLRLEQNFVQTQRTILLKFEINVYNTKAKLRYKYF